MKTTFFKKGQPDPELAVLRAELQSAQGDLSLAYRQFDQAVDPEKARCNYLIRAIKERSPESIPALSRLEGDAVWT